MILHFMKNGYDYDIDETYSSDVSQTEYALTLMLNDKQSFNTTDEQHPNRIYTKMKVAGQGIHFQLNTGATATSCGKQI